MLSSVFLLLLINILNIRKTRMADYVLLTLMFLFAFVGTIFDNFAVSSRYLAGAELYFKLAAFLFSLTLFTFNIFLVKISKVGNTVPVAIISFLFGIELLDLYLFKPQIIWDNGYKLLVVRSLFGYAARSIASVISLSLFTGTAIGFIQMASTKLRKWIVILAAVVSLILAIFTGIYPLLLFGKTLVETQSLGAFIGAVFLTVLTVIDPYLPLVWRGKYMGVIVFDKGGVLYFTDFIDETSSALASGLIAAIISFIGEFFDIGSASEYRNLTLTLPNAELTILLGSKLNLTVIHSDLPEMALVYFKNFLVEVEKIVEIREGLVVSVGEEKIKKLFEEEVLSKIF